MRLTLAPFILFAGLSASHLALAANPEAAKSMAANICAGCHGAKGISSAGSFPSLAGQKEEYLAAQMRAFRDKTRANPVMSGMASSLKDEEIANLAAYYAGLKACE